MFELRQNEPAYAMLPKVTNPETNRYGMRIDLAAEHPELTGKSLCINGDKGIGGDSNRYKQHGFYFNADNCIACHACESACSEKNNLPPHIAFRSVGYVEGGTWPNTVRLNISMACNHCDDPVCLKGCPTRAYTKFAEYGAVLQDPDICFGCGYCTWVCPYNAPQLDTKAGHVSKCNMCVDRLEVGLKPACAAACLAGALDFGIIETAPENRVQQETQIPGFPTPEITHPNLRFQQTKSLPREMKRPDSMPLRYVRDAHGAAGVHKPMVAEDDRERGFNLDKLSTRENPLVVFTLVSQAVIGAFLLLLLAPYFGMPLLSPDTHPIAWPVLLFGLIGFETLALVLSTMHLGKPHRFYRAFNNLRWSPVSREVAGIAVFYHLLGAYTLLTGVPALTDWLEPETVAMLAQGTGWAAAAAGIAALWFMYRIYRIPARPFWNHWQVLTSFYGSMLTLGALTVGIVTVTLALASGEVFAGVGGYLAWPMAAGLAIEAVGLFFHARDLKRAGGEGAASHYVQTTAFGHTYILRNVMLGIAMLAVSGLTISGMGGAVGLMLWMAVALLIVANAVVGRMLFYALVIPTTMPGAFFWHNREFEGHARKAGLAAMPQTGVVADAH